MMQTPLPVQVEHWLKIIDNKRSPNDLKEQAMLHLTNIRDTIDKHLTSAKLKKRYENMSTR